MENVEGTIGEAHASEAVAHELLVIHAEADADAYFVRSELLPALGLPDDRVMLSSELPLGGFAIDRMEAALHHSRVTMIVVSPAFLEENWPLFSEVLASYHAVDGNRQLVPIHLADCKMPLRLKARVTVDLRNSRHRTRGLRRLRNMFISASLPAPLPPARMEQHPPRVRASLMALLRDFSSFVLLVALLFIVASAKGPQPVPAAPCACITAHLPATGSSVVI